MSEFHPKWIGHLRAPKENISRQSLEDLFVCVSLLTDDQGLLLDLKPEDVVQKWVFEKFIEKNHE